MYCPGVVQFSCYLVSVLQACHPWPEIILLVVQEGRSKTRYPCCHVGGRPKCVVLKSRTRVDYYYYYCCGKSFFQRRTRLLNTRTRGKKSRASHGSVEQAAPCARRCPENTQRIAWMPPLLLVHVLLLLLLLLLLSLVLLLLEYKGASITILLIMHRGIADQDRSIACVKYLQLAGTATPAVILPPLVAAFQPAKSRRTRQKHSEREERLVIGCTINRRRVRGARA